jgi:predicted nucleic acid-binding protein
VANLLFESSAFAKYFQSEEGSERVITLMDDPTNQTFISWLTLVEMHSALARRVRMGELTVAEFEQVRRHLYAQLRSGRFRVVWWSSRHLWEAIRLLLRYGATDPLRALDALQLAVALDLKEQGLLDGFVCADDLLCALAQREGLAVINPKLADGRPP